MTTRFLLTVLLTVTTFSFLSAASAQAKNNGPRHTTPLESFQYVISQLDLTADQQTKADRILDDLQKKLDDVKQQAKSDREKRKSAVAEFKKALLAARTDIEKILTPEQTTKLRKLLVEERDARKEQQQERIEHRNGKRPAASQPAA